MGEVQKGHKLKAKKPLRLEAKTQKIPWTKMKKSHTISNCLSSTVPKRDYVTITKIKSTLRMVVFVCSFIKLLK